MASRRGSSACLCSGSTMLHTYCNEPLDVFNSNDGSKPKDSFDVNTSITYANIAGDDVPDVGFLSDENIYYNLPPPAPHGGLRTASLARVAQGQASPPIGTRKKVLQGANSCPSSPKLPKSPHYHHPHQGISDNKCTLKTPPLTGKNKKLVHTRSFDLDHLYQNLVRVATRPRSNSFSVPWRRRKKVNQETSQVSPPDIQEETREDSGDKPSQNKYQQIPLLSEYAPRPPSYGIIFSRPTDATSSCSRSKSSRSSSTCSENSSNGSDFGPCSEVYPGITYLREASPEEVEQQQDWEWYHSADTLPLRKTKPTKEKQEALSAQPHLFTADINRNLEEWRKKERWLGKKRSARNLRLQGIGGGEVDVALFFASDGINWTRYLQDIFSSLVPDADDDAQGQPTHNLRCELLNVEELKEELSPIKAEKLKTAKLQVVLVSPKFLNHVHAYPDTDLGKVFIPDRVMGLLLGVQDEDVTPLHIAALYSYSDWRRLDVRNMDISFVVEVLTQGTYILSNCDVYQGYQNSGTARFKVTPKKVNETQRRLFVILDENIENIEEVTVLIRQEGKATKAIENVRLLNPYTLVFKMPDEYLHISSLLFISVLVGHTDLGCRQLKCESKMDTLKDILHTVANTTHFMCQAMNINPISDELDRKLADMVRNHTPLEKLDITHEYYGNGGSDFPTWLHFASHYGLEHLAWALLELPGGEAALTMPNFQGHTPPLLAYREKFVHFARELEDAALISTLAVSVYPRLSGTTELSSDTLQGTSYSTPPPPRPITSTTPPAQNPLASTTSQPPQLLPSPCLHEYDQPSPPRPISWSFLPTNETNNQNTEGSPCTPVVSTSLLDELHSHNSFRRTSSSELSISRYVDMSGQEPSTPMSEYPESVYALVDAWNRKMNIKTFMEDNQEIISEVKTSFDNQNRKMSNASQTNNEENNVITASMQEEDAWATSPILNMVDTFSIYAATDTNPTSTTNTPILSTSTPTPFYRTPTTFASTPTTFANTPTSSTSTPIPSSSTLIPSSSTPIPSSSTPIPSCSTPSSSSGTSNPSTRTPSTTLTPNLSVSVAADSTAAGTPPTDSSTPRHYQFSTRNRTAIGNNFFKLLRGKRGMRSPPVHLGSGAGRSLHDQPNDYIPDPTFRTQNGYNGDSSSSESEDDEPHGETPNPIVDQVVPIKSSQSPVVLSARAHYTPDPLTRPLPTPRGHSTRPLPTPPDPFSRQLPTPPDPDTRLPLPEYNDPRFERPPQPPPRPIPTGGWEDHRPPQPPPRPTVVNQQDDEIYYITHDQIASVPTKSDMIIVAEKKKHMVRICYENAPVLKKKPH